MNFSRKIYYNDKPLILTTDKEAYINSDPFAETFDTYSGGTLRSFTQALRQLDMPGVRGAIIEDATEDALIEQLMAMYRPIDAAGGVAYNEDGAILMIFRRGKWDLPKGKLDEGEDIEACALREVTEETGLQQLELSDKVCDTYHIYTQNSEQFLKRTAWYKMKATAADKLKPQKEENILEARWVSARELAPFASRSYEAIRDVLKRAGFKW